MSCEAWQVLAAASVLALGAAGANAHGHVDEHIVTTSNRSTPTVIAAHNASCPDGTVDNDGYRADGEAQSEQQVQPPPLLRSPTEQIQNVIQSIQNLKHKCRPTQVWSGQEKGCVEND